MCWQVTAVFGLEACDLIGELSGRDPATRATGLASALRVFLRGSGLELESDEPLVADHPGVVAGLDDVRLARTDLDLGAVLVLHRQPARVNHADMAGPAGLGPGGGLAAARPPPPRLDRNPPRGRPAHTHDTPAGFVGPPRLVGQIEPPLFHTRHDRLLSS